MRQLSPYEMLYSTYHFTPPVPQESSALPDLIEWWRQYFVFFFGPRLPKLQVFHYTPNTIGQPIRSNHKLPPQEHGVLIR